MEPLTTGRWAAQCQVNTQTIRYCERLGLRTDPVVCPPAIAFFSQDAIQ